MIDIFGIISIDASYVVIALLATIVFSIITFILAIVGIVKASKMKKKYNQFMAGSDGTSIEKLIKSNLRDVKEIKNTTIKNLQEIYIISLKQHFAKSELINTMRSMRWAAS